jgi:hypothetical protein
MWHKDMSFVFAAMKGEKSFMVFENIVLNNYLQCFG